MTTLSSKWSQNVQHSCRQRYLQAWAKQLQNHFSLASLCFDHQYYKNERLTNTLTSWFSYLTYWPFLVDVKEKLNTPTFKKRLQSLNNRNFYVKSMCFSKIFSTNLTSSLYFRFPTSIPSSFAKICLAIRTEEVLHNVSLCLGHKFEKFFHFWFAVVGSVAVSSITASRSWRSRH